MRLGRLELTAFGPFTDKVLDFGARPRALQLIYGPNEAGKSSTLRALTGLLYGIDARTQDAHLHEMTKLRVGATLLGEAGEALHVVRRKGAKNTLLDAEGQPLGDGALLPWLGGLDEALFEQMFGLDHQRLRDGAEALLRGGGQLGEVLFDASTGGRSVHQVLAQLRAEADALYKQRGRTPELNAALAAYEDHKKQRQAKALLPQAYADQIAALAEAKAEREQLVTERRGLLAERARLARSLALSPLFASRDQLAAALAQAPAQPDSLEQSVRELERRLGSVQAGERELPQQRVALAALEREIGDLRARLGGDVAVLHDLDAPTRGRLRKLIEERRERCAEAAELARKRAEAEREGVRLAEAHAQLGEPLHGELAALVEELTREDLLGALTNGERELARLRGEQARKLAQLGVLLCPELPLPGEDVLGALELTLEEAQREQQRLTRALKEQASEQARLERSRDDVLAAGALVDRDELARVRAERDAALDALFASAEAERASALRRHAALSERADVLADRRVEQAQRAGELTRIEQALATLSRECLSQRAQLEEVERTLRDARERWTCLLAPWQLSERPARQVRKDLLELEQLRRRHAELGALEAEQEALRVRARERTRQLSLALGQDDELEPLLRKARALLAQEAQRMLHRERVSAQRERNAAEQAALGARTELVQQELAQNQARYRAELGARKLPLELQPDELFACFDELLQLSQRLREADDLRARISSASTERTQLAAELAALEPCAGDSFADLDAALSRLRARVQAQGEQRRLAEELKALDTRIEETAQGMPLDALREDVSGLDRDLAQARLVELEEQLEACAQRGDELERKIGAVGGGLERLEQVSGAAELAEQCELDLARARSLGRRYVELKLGIALLEREVERYRSEHQGPVLKRAAELFRRLTLERYRNLKVEYDQQDMPVLACQLGGQATVRMEGLSDGTRDQLYLSLRIASIERYCQGRPAVPLVLDDVLIHFDDGRAAVALELLAALGAHTQVLFFTHHARMVELASSALGEQVQVHELCAQKVARSDGPLFELPS